MKSFLFLPDISGFTEFIQSTEAEHSQHVIQELLTILIQSNILDLELAEVEGDALFFYKEEVPTLEKIMAQVEHMYTAFYSHLELLKNNRICPCNACLTAPNLELKIIVHCGDIQFINLQGKRKPFGTEVIQLHRLLKNSVDSNNYVLFTSNIQEDVGLADNYKSKLFQFESGSDIHDGEELNYVYSTINKEELQLKPYSFAHKVQPKGSPTFTIDLEFDVPKLKVMEYVTNYKYRHEWSIGVDAYEFNENEVTREGSEHVCIINGKHLNFVTITKDAPVGINVYGESTEAVGPVKAVQNFYLFKTINDNRTKVTIEVYITPKNFFNSIFIALVLKRVFKKTTLKNFLNLKRILEQS
ncbi:DUF2652 domain-containing protein [Flammeovirga sp. MY04]|uniref:DUF2652 domain-containing protein n=1 Tax=Flammeovirga sp. MY04 TaxID=1191459 RepID=UPI0008062FFF|nr:DUF2652 domain-containing protein [Flammeovirga sp. MY04]ANQ52163.1 DUF2652 domain-containing protein [Flammeovirga sp. MY04]